MTIEAKMSSPPLSRRSFLKGAGAAATLLAAGHVLPVIPTVAGSVPDLSVGVVLPASGGRPAALRAFRDGLRLAADTVEAAHLNFHTVSTAAGRVALWRGIKQMLERDVRVVVAMTTPDVAAWVQPLMADRDVPLLVSSAGANAVAEELPYGFFHTLHYWQSNWAAGQWAAANLGRRALVAGSFRESGYDALYAFERGFTAAGGQLLDTFVSHVPPHPVTFDRLWARAAALRPDFLFASYAGSDAADFVAAFDRSDLVETLPLMTGAFFAEEAVPESAPAWLRRAPRIVPWAPTLARPANRAFTAGYVRRTGRAADNFALLGYETGQLLALAAGSGGRLVDALSSARWLSPRGALRMDASASTTHADLYVHDGNDLLPAALSSQQATWETVVKTGWTEPYIL